MLDQEMFLDEISGDPIEVSAKTNVSPRTIVAAQYE